MFRKLQTDESGYALVLILIIMVVLMILGTALLNTSVSENRFANWNEDKLQAYYIARSGAQAVADYMVADHKGDAKNLVGYASEDNAQVGGGTLSVSVEADASNPDAVRVISTGLLNGVSQTVKILLTKTGTGVGGIFDHAIVGEEILVIGNKVNIEGNIATVSDDADSIQYTNESQTTLEGSEITGAQLTFPEVEMPEIIPAANQLGAIDSSTDLPDSDPGVRENYFTSTGIDLGNSESIVAKSYGTATSGPNTIVHLFVEGDVSLGTKASLTTEEGALFYLYVIGERTVSISGAGSMNNVFIYAPDSLIDWGNAQPDAVFTGGLIGKTVKIPNQVSVIYNRDFANYSQIDTSNIGIEYTNYRWID